MSLHIKTLGAGPDLVLIHGWAMHAGILAPLVRELALRFRLHLVDLPGHGWSRDDAGSLAPDEVARRIAERVPRATWIGWSLGGLVALEAALSGQVRALVEVAANPRFVIADDWPHGVPAQMFTQFADGLRTDYRRTIERFLALEAHGSDRAQAELRELKVGVFAHGEPALTALCQGLEVLERTDLRARLTELRVPNLWIAGRRDRLIPPAAMAWAAAQSPRGKFMEFSAGHAPFLGHAAEVADAIAVFVEASP